MVADLSGGAVCLVITCRFCTVGGAEPAGDHGSSGQQVLAWRRQRGGRKRGLRVRGLRVRGLRERGLRERGLRERNPPNRVRAVDDRLGGACRAQARR